MVNFFFPETSAESDYQYPNYTIEVSSNFMDNDEENKYSTIAAGLARADALVAAGAPRVAVYVLGGIWAEEGLTVNESVDLIGTLGSVITGPAVPTPGTSLVTIAGAAFPAMQGFAFLLTTSNDTAPVIKTTGLILLKDISFIAASSDWKTFLEVGSAGACTCMTSGITGYSLAADWTNMFYVNTDASQLRLSDTMIYTLAGSGRVLDTCSCGAPAQVIVGNNVAIEVVAGMTWGNADTNALITLNSCQVDFTDTSLYSATDNPAQYVVSPGCVVMEEMQSNYVLEGTMTSGGWIDVDLTVGGGSGVIAVPAGASAVMLDVETIPTVGDAPSTDSMIIFCHPDDQAVAREQTRCPAWNPDRLSSRTVVVRLKDGKSLSYELLYDGVTGCYVKASVIGWFIGT